MTNQIIKNNVDIFDSYITNFFIKENEYYLFNEDLFKSMIYNNNIYNFLEKLKNYYYKSKYYYLLRKPITYIQFSTILRQICNKNNIRFEKNIKYKMSKYNVEYKLYLSV